MVFNWFLENASCCGVNDAVILGTQTPAAESPWLSTHTHTRALVVLFASEEQIRLPRLRPMIADCAGRRKRRKPHGPTRQFDTLNIKELALF